MQRMKTPNRGGGLAEQSSSVMSGSFFPEDVGKHLKDKITSFVSERKSRINAIQSTQNNKHLGEDDAANVY
jgi:hypothetical protein